MLKRQHFRIQAGLGTGVLLVLPPVVYGAALLWRWRTHQRRQRPEYQRARKAARRALTALRTLRAQPGDPAGCDGVQCAHLFWRRATLLWGLAGAAFFCLVLTASTLLTHYQHSTRQAGVIVAAEVVVRKGNGESYAPQLSQPLHAGTEFEVLEARGSWLAIQLDNGTSGWIRRESASLL